MLPITSKALDNNASFQNISHESGIKHLPEVLNLFSSFVFQTPYTQSGLKLFLDDFSNQVFSPARPYLGFHADCFATFKTQLISAHQFIKKELKGKGSSHPSADHRAKLDLAKQNITSAASILQQLIEQILAAKYSALANGYRVQLLSAEDLCSPSLVVEENSLYLAISIHSVLYRVMDPFHEKQEGSIPWEALGDPFEALSLDLTQYVPCLPDILMITAQNGHTRTYSPQVIKSYLSLIELSMIAMQALTLVYLDVSSMYASVHADNSPQQLHDLTEYSQRMDQLLAVYIVAQHGRITQKGRQPFWLARWDTQHEYELYGYDSLDELKDISQYWTFMVDGKTKWCVIDAQMRESYYRPNDVIYGDTGYHLALTYRTRPRDVALAPQVIYLYCIDDFLEYAVKTKHGVERCYLMNRLGNDTETIKSVLNDPEEMKTLSDEQRATFFDIIAKKGYAPSFLHQKWVSGANANASPMDTKQVLVSLWVNPAIDKMSTSVAMMTTYLNTIKKNINYTIAYHDLTRFIDEEPAPVDSQTLRNFIELMTQDDKNQLLLRGLRLAKRDWVVFYLEQGVTTNVWDRFDQDNLLDQLIAPGLLNCFLDNECLPLFTDKTLSEVIRSKISLRPTFGLFKDQRQRALHIEALRTLNQANIEPRKKTRDHMLDSYLTAEVAGPKWCVVLMLSLWSLQMLTVGEKNPPRLILSMVCLAGLVGLLFVDRKNEQQPEQSMNSLRATQ